VLADPDASWALARWHPAPPARPYNPSLHDALPIWPGRGAGSRSALRPRHPHLEYVSFPVVLEPMGDVRTDGREQQRSTVGSSTTDRKSTRLNSSHQIISYAVVALKKKTSIATEDGP